MESNKTYHVPTSENQGTNLQTAANTGISIAEKEKSPDNSEEDYEYFEDPQRTKNKDSEYLEDPKRENKTPNPDSPDFGDNPLRSNHPPIKEDANENTQSNK
jgi:hypothetical protein